MTNQYLWSRYYLGLCGYIRKQTLGKIKFQDDMQAVHIVMVDDDEEDLFLTKLGFENSEFAFKFTGLDSADALFNYIDVNGIDHIDILLLDLNMPETDGLDALKQLQQKPEIKNIKSFVYSTSKDQEDLNQCVQAGADGYLFKPSTAQEQIRFVNTIALASEFWV